MKTKVKTAWITALKSGDYKQTTGYLRENDSFCCLGVLCNLHAIAHPKVAVDETDPDSYLGETTGLPFAVMRWAGITSSSGEYDNQKYFEDRSLDKDNDWGKTFNEIADIINKHF